MTRYARIVLGMTQTMKRFRQRTGIAAIGAALMVATVFGPPAMSTTRLGAASELTGYATVSPADTITSRTILGLASGQKA
jgi:hypothetical protein